MPNNSFVDYSGESIDENKVDKLLVRHEESGRYLAHTSSNKPVSSEIPNTNTAQNPEIDQFILAAADTKAVEEKHTRNTGLFKWPFIAVLLAMHLIGLSGCLVVGGNLKTNAATPLPTFAVPTLHPFFQTQQPDQVITPTTIATPLPEQDQPTPTTRPIIHLLNPASGLVIMSTESLAFEWSYSVPLTPDQQFLLKMTNETGSQTLGVVTTPKSGFNYFLTIDLSVWESISGNHQWYVTLETISGGEELLRSEPQLITVNTVVLEATPVLTPTLTLTPEITVTDPTLTPNPVCTPAPPSGWVVYIVKEGDYLFNLALDTGSTVERLQEVNCLSVAGLGVGQRLWLPAIPPTQTPSSIPAAIPTTASSDNG